MVVWLVVLWKSCKVLSVDTFRRNHLPRSRHESRHFIHMAHCKLLHTLVNYAKLMTEKPIHFGWKYRSVSWYTPNAPEQCWTKMVFCVAHRLAVFSGGASAQEGSWQWGAIEHRDKDQINPLRVMLTKCKRRYIKATHAHIPYFRVNLPLKWICVNIMHSHIRQIVCLGCCYRQQRASDVLDKIWFWFFA